MSESFFVFVQYDHLGQSGEERFINKQIHSAVRATKRKYRGCTITGTTTRMVSAADKCIPKPPEGWKPAMFRVNMKKNRFGRLVNGKAEEIE